MIVKSHCPNSNYYWAEVTFENRGSHTIGFWENLNDYRGIISFGRTGMVVEHNFAYDFFKKFSKELLPQPAYLSKVIVAARGKLKKSVLLYVYDKKLLLKNAKELRPIFMFYDVNISYDADVYRPAILCDNIVKFDWE